MFIANGFAQQTFKQSDIIAKKWKTEKAKTNMKFTNTKIIFSNCYLLNFKYEYYLSDAIDTVFDKSKLGNSHSGRYIISKHPKDKDSIFNTSIDEILMLTDNTLIVRSIPFLICGGSVILEFHTVDWYKKNKNIQQTFQLSDIVDKKWKIDSIIDFPGQSGSIEYKNNEKFIGKSYIEENEKVKEKIVENEYYLTDNIDTFKKKKHSNGKYITKRDDKKLLVSEEIGHSVNGRHVNYFIIRDRDGLFYKSKVGKSSSGRYIVTRDSRGCLWIYEILKLTDNILILKHLNNVYGSGIMPLHKVSD